MEFNEAKTALKNGYQNAGFELVDEHQTELFFRHQENQFYVAEEDIAEYANTADVVATLQAIPVECSVCGPIYREHVLEIPDLARRRFFAPRDRDIIFGEVNDSNVYVAVGQASPVFMNYFRFDENYMFLSLERIRRTYLRSTANGKLDIREYLYRPPTIRVYNIQETTPEAALKRAIPIIDACLFELSYLRNLTFTLSESWHVRQPKIRPFTYGDPVLTNQFSIPTANFNSDIIRFYQRGTIGEDPVNQFLSFYQILEYYFIEVTDELLYNKLSRRINDPRFSTTPKNLNRIIQDVIDHKRVTDETEMLKSVLAKYVDETELLEFIRTYEAYLNKEIYTKKRTVFGEELQVSTSPGYIIPTVAKVIKTIRNALVHSSDRYERKDRYIPSTSSEKLIRQELPLIKFLAERVIIASAK